jgi:chorismate synthase
MAGNSTGQFFRITTFGESHGKAVGVVIDGVRPGMRIHESDIQKELDRRRPGQSGVTTSRQEKDRVEILSGVFQGKTLGTPICLLIRNTDQNPKAYEAVRALFRPGHAGYTYLAKYGIHDYRGGGRSSGRETAGRVGGGAVARAILKQKGIQIIAHTKQVGPIVAGTFDPDEIERNPVRSADPQAAKRMERIILKVKNEGDSLGGIVEAVVRGCPAGLGEPVFDKIEADLARALLSIPAIKGFEIGSGFAAARMRGSEHNDEFYSEKRSGRIRTRTNHAGGVLGGITNGEEIVIRVAVKPPSSIPKKQHTVDLHGSDAMISVEGRHDPCLCPRVVPVVESMIAVVIADHLMRQSLLRGLKGVAPIRRQIDTIDDMIMLLLGERQALVRDIGRIKRASRSPIPDRRREREIMRKRLGLLQDAGLTKELVAMMYKAIFEHSRTIQSKS